MGLFTKKATISTYRFTFKKVLINENGIMREACALSKFEFVKLGNATIHGIKVPTEYKGLKVVGILPNIYTSYLNISNIQDFAFVCFLQNAPIVQWGCEKILFDLRRMSRSGNVYSNFSPITYGQFARKLPNMIVTLAELHDLQDKYKTRFDNDYETRSNMILLRTYDSLVYKSITILDIIGSVEIPQY